MSNKKYHPSKIVFLKKNIFDGIDKSPSYYQDKPVFSVSEVYPEDEMEKQYYDHRVLVSNNEIVIEYWVYDNNCELKIVTITNNTELSRFGKYIGMGKEEILSLFDKPNASADSELHYFREDRKYAVHFWFKDKVAYKINLVGSL